MIGGFIITGSGPKIVAIRALGPSLSNFGVTRPLADPRLELRDATGGTIAKNNSWRGAQAGQIVETGLMPPSELEAAIVRALSPGAYTASVTDEHGGSGVGLLEIYDLDRQSNSRLGNISARGFVGRGDDVLIGGFIIAGTAAQAPILVRAMGPSLASAGVTDALPDPTLELRDMNGALVASNNDWRDSQAAEVLGSSLAPPSDKEPAAVANVAPGAYTAVVRGRHRTTGIAVLEVYRLR